MKNAFIHRAILAIVSTLLFLQSDGVFAVTITLQNQVTVSEDKVQLKDIATFNREDDFTRILGSQFIVTSPAAGESLTLNTLDIKTYLSNKMPLPPDLIWQGGATITISRDAITIGPEKIQKIIDEFIAENLHNLPRGTVSFVARTFPEPFHLPNGKLSYQVTPSNPSIAKSTGMNIIFKIDGLVKKNIMVRGQIKALARVAVTTMPLRRGDIIQYDQVTLEERDIAKVTSPCFTINDLVGKQTNSNLRAHQVIERTAVETAPVIKRGDIVKIRVRSHGMQLSATGIAKSDGKVDDVIRVRNSSSNKTIYCMVSGPGLVEVKI